MSTGRRARSLTLVALAACAAPRAAARLAVPPPGRVYHGVHPGGATGAEDDVTPAALDAYERAVGRRVAWVYFSNEWGKTRAFPRATAAWIRARGAVPFIRLMLRSGPETRVREPRFTLDAIARGDFDADLAAWADDARAFGPPLLVELGTEVNGDWFPWSAPWAGEHAAARFRGAYRHVVSVMRARGLDAAWVFHVNVPDAPGAAHALERAWPGGDVVDWVALSFYAPRAPDDDAEVTRDLDAYVARVTAIAPGKPIVLAEIGADGARAPEQAARWADATLAAIVGGRWPAVRGLAWWSERWPNDAVAAHDTEMRVAHVPALSRVLRARLAGDRVVDRPILR